MTDIKRMFRTPALSLSTQRRLADLHHIMMRWHGLGEKTSTAYRNWKRCVDCFLDEVEGSIYLMGYNQLDHGRRKEKT